MSRSSERAAAAVKEEVRIMPVASTPESNTILLAIARPKEGEVLSDNPVWIQFRIDGFSLGADSSQFERADQIPVGDMGQTVRVVVDSDFYFSVNEPTIDPFNENGYYYDTSYKFELPSSLKPGMHTLRMFPARSFGESLKGENTFVAATFFVGGMTPKLDVDFSAPFLTYNQPSDEVDWNQKQPILLDFLVANCELTPDGYWVRLTLDGKVKRSLTSWQPYYIYGLSKGKHTIRLELMNGKSLVPGLFNAAERTISVQ